MNAKSAPIEKTDRPTLSLNLRTGWTTGTCATGAAMAAFHGLFNLPIPSIIEVNTPAKKTASLPIHQHGRVADDIYQAAIIKDAGDDPDVTHGALIHVKLQSIKTPNIIFKAGDGVGIVTKPGLPLEVGEPAINPVPRSMIENALHQLCQTHQKPFGFMVEIGVDKGKEIAKQTWNPRLGIEGGISILGTSGIVRPYSCSAWIASIHRGIDVGIANHYHHMIAVTGNQSEKMARQIYSLSDSHIIDMGDFIGGMLKYMRKHPLPYLTIAGGFAKMLKFAQGAMDLHSKRSQIDFAQLTNDAKHIGIDANKVATSHTGLDLLQNLSKMEQRKLLTWVTSQCQQRAMDLLHHQDTKLEFMLADRQGNLLFRHPTEP